jgi:hypothetical protein
MFGQGEQMAEHILKTCTLMTSRERRAETHHWENLGMWKYWLKTLCSKERITAPSFHLQTPLSSHIHYSQVSLVKNIMITPQKCASPLMKHLYIWAISWRTFLQWLTGLFKVYSHHLKNKIKPCAICKQANLLRVPDLLIFE